MQRPDSLGEPLHKHYLVQAWLSILCLLVGKTLHDTAHPGSAAVPMATCAAAATTILLTCRNDATSAELMNALGDEALSLHCTEGLDAALLGLPVADLGDAKQSTGRIGAQLLDAVPIPVLRGALAKRELRLGGSSCTSGMKPLALAAQAAVPPHAFLYCCGAVSLALVLQAGKT